MVFKAGDPKPKGSGRGKGTPNKRTQAKQQAPARGETPLQFFEKMMAGEKFKLANGEWYEPTVEDMRWAAAQAAPYRHPRLSAVRVSDSQGKSHEEWLKEIEEGLDK